MGSWVYRRRQRNEREEDYQSLFEKAKKKKTLPFQERDVALIP